MPTTFPLELSPSAIDDRLVPEHSVSRFQAENGLDTVICYGCAGHSTSFTLRFEPLTVLEEAKMVQFLNSIGVSQNGSCKSFLLPDCWSGWKLIRSWPVWREALTVDKLDRHWWRVTSRPPMNGEYCFFQGIAITIENVARRA